MRRLAAALSLAVAAGCGFSAPSGIGPGGDAAGSDHPEAGSEPAGDAAPLIDAQMLDGCTTFSQVIDTCAIGPFGTPLAITNDKTYNTDSHKLSDGQGNDTTPTFFETTIGGAQVTLLVTQGFTIDPNGDLRVTGTRAFGVVSSSTITISGDLDASNKGAGARGGGACGTSAGGPGSNNNAQSGGAAGGGGGGYGAAGGRGAKGDVPGAGVTGGNPGQAVALTAALLGGCPGGKGGKDGASGGNGGDGGDGGGAVFLSAAGALTVSGRINAGGAGGEKGDSIDGGAGGGGSGGMVVLESPAITIAGAVAANGGGGGGGAGNSSGTDGQTGQASASAASGGTRGGAGSDGSSGGARSQPAANQPADAGGGGGGAGGGAGFVTYRSTGAPNISGTTSPAIVAYP